jgi:hypothetical protein
VTLSQTLLETIKRKFTSPGIKALALKGSYARGTADEFSDVDILRLAEEGATLQDDGSHWLEHKLVTLSTAFPNDVETYFTQPGPATQVIAGLRHAKILYDPEGVFAEVQGKARAFVWTSELQTKANLEVSQHMVGLVEEVQKGLGGLRTNHVGRLLQTRYGLSWLLAGVMQLKLGVLIESDNSVVEQLTQAVGVDSAWSYWCYRAFGIEEPGLYNEVRAGLNLYLETYKLVQEILRPEDRLIIHQAIKLIEGLEF